MLGRVIFLVFALFCFNTISLALYPSRACAEDLSLHGFLQANYSARLTGLQPPTSEGGDFLFGEERFQLRLDKSGEKGRLFIRTDFFHDAIANRPDLEVREAYVDTSMGGSDVRVGRQLLIWGTGDYLFINDLFAKDWGAFFSGRPVEYLRVPQDAAKLDLSAGWISAEIVAMPFFQADKLPSRDRFYQFDPFPGVARSTQQPAMEFQNTELAARVYGTTWGFDTALYLYRGFFHMPGLEADRMIAPTQIAERFPRLAVYGASTRGNALGGVVSTEVGYYDSLADHAGRDPIIPNSSFRYLAGYQRQLWEDFTLGLQYYGEIMMQYDVYRASAPSGFPVQDQHRQLMTLRLTQLFWNQTLRVGLFAFYSPTDQDYYLIPEIRYSISDNLWVSATGNIFGGRRTTTFFGQFGANDNLAVTVRYEF
ncbi:MAG TPA: hypothetical protein VFF86_01540 [Candidatus Methylomirabilis sp.]|nr:hypothetical protein [Candidatus Methylomirabilis sp.]